MDFLEIRRLVVIALFSDQTLLDRLVLKGGNALELVHRVIQRGSLDIDLAMAGDFEDIADVRRRMVAALEERFDEVGLQVFDTRLEPRPSTPNPQRPPKWGGYLFEFKLITKERASKIRNDPGKMRREAHTLGTTQNRVFRVDISKYEFCAGKALVDLDGHTIYVYTPEMCAIEKLRALCQQMPEYQPTSGMQRPRARDFYDIYQTVERLGLDLSTPANLELCKDIFAAKEVPLRLLGLLPGTREFHRTDWDQVRLALPVEPRDFDYYFDYVALVVLPKLKPLWVEETPS